MKTKNMDFGTTFLIIYIFMFGLLTAQPKKVLDDFSTLNGWKVNASDLVVVSPSMAEGKNGNAVKIEYNFTSGSGYGGIQKQFSLALPSNYLFSFDIKADSPDNTLEFKLIDKSGDNV